MPSAFNARGGLPSTGKGQSLKANTKASGGRPGLMKRASVRVGTAVKSPRAQSIGRGATSVVVSGLTAKAHLDIAKSGASPAVRIALHSALVSNTRKATGGSSPGSHRGQHRDSRGRFA